MNKKITISFAVVLIVAVVVFMAKDFFFSDNKTQENPYEYNIDKLKDIPEDKICYKEVQQINPTVGKIKAISINKNDNIYIAGDSGIEIYNTSLEKMNTINFKKQVSCIYVNDKNIFLGVSDQVEILDLQGKIAQNISFIDTGVVITSIAAKDSSLFIADAGNKIVYHYNLDGKFKNLIGKKDTVQGIPGFIIPSPYFDLAIDREGELWVVNPGRHALEMYSEDGKLKSRWFKTSMQLEGFSGCCNPSHIAILSDGSFVTSEKGIERVKIHDPTGKFKCVVAPPNKFEEGTKGLDLAVDSQDRIYILDPNKKMIRIFEKK